MSYLNKLFLILLFGVYCEARRPLKKEAYMTVPELTKAEGYPSETYHVPTPDGYILLLHRIPGGRLRQTGKLNAKRKKAVLILHGLGGCSSNFVIMGPKRSIGYLLADAGYDVWLPNLRGTYHSAHVNLTNTDEKFWNFSFHEHGLYDVPAVIDHILNVTGLQKIMCLGHSLGNTNFFVMLSLRPEYNDKIIAFVAIGPALFLDNMKSVANLALNTLKITKVLRANGLYAIYPELVQNIQLNVCNLKKHPLNDPCTVVIEFLFGTVLLEQHDEDMAPIYLNRIQPLGWNSLEHYGKIALTGEFTTFRGGYNGPVEPYNTSNIKVPTTIMYGDNDRFSSKADIVRLSELLKANGVLENVDVERRTWRKFNHVGFVVAKDVGRLFNRPLVKHIDKMYNKYGPV